MYYPIPTFMVTQESLSTSTEMLCCLLTSYISLNSQLGTISPHHGLAALSETFWFVPTEQGGGGECYWHRARRGQGAIRHPTHSAQESTLRRAPDCTSVNGAEAGKPSCCTCPQQTPVTCSCHSHGSRSGPEVRHTQ